MKITEAVSPRLFMMDNATMQHPISSLAGLQFSTLNVLESNWYLEEPFKS
jgi:hypothetical protein